MNLLEAARQIAGCEPLEEYGPTLSCIHCWATRQSDFDLMPVTEHREGCPWLLMPQIVAALEVADELTALVLHRKVWQYPSYGPGVRDDQVAAYRYEAITKGTLSDAAPTT